MKIGKVGRGWGSEEGWKTSNRKAKQNRSKQVSRSPREVEKLAAKQLFYPQKAS